MLPIYTQQVGRNTSNLILALLWAFPINWLACDQSFVGGGSSTWLQAEDGCSVVLQKQESPPKRKRTERAQIRLQLRLSPHVSATDKPPHHTTRRNFFLTVARRTARSARVCKQKHIFKYNCTDIYMLKHVHARRQAGMSTTLQNQPITSLVPLPVFWGCKQEKEAYISLMPHALIGSPCACPAKTWPRDTHHWHSHVMLTPSIHWWSPTYSVNSSSSCLVWGVFL